MAAAATRAQVPVRRLRRCNLAAVLFCALIVLVSLPASSLLLAFVRPAAIDHGRHRHGLRSVSPSPATASDSFNSIAAAAHSRRFPHLAEGGDVAAPALAASAAGPVLLPTRLVPRRVPTDAVTLPARPVTRVVARAAVVAQAALRPARALAIADSARLRLTSAAGVLPTIFKAKNSQPLQGLAARSGPGAPVQNPDLAGPQLAEPIDAVYTWVDDHDSVWHADADRLAPGRAPNKFREWGELRFSMRSLAKNMPWLRHIYIVTSGPTQVPDFLDPASERVSLVHHAQLFEDAGGLELPTFNSLAIESVLHRIPGLSTHFLYVNNDLLVVKPTSSAFFRTATRYRRFTEWNAVRSAKCRRVMAELSDAVAPAALAAALSQSSVSECLATQAFFLDEVHARRAFGESISHWSPHVPHLMTKSVLLEVEAQLAAPLAVTRRNRVRDLQSDINIFLQGEALLRQRMREAKGKDAGTGDEPVIVEAFPIKGHSFFGLFENGPHDWRVPTVFVKARKAVAAGVRFVGLEDDLTASSPAATLQYYRAQLTDYFTELFPEPAEWERRAEPDPATPAVEKVVGAAAAPPGDSNVAGADFADATAVKALT